MHMYPVKVESERHLLDLVSPVAVGSIPSRRLGESCSRSLANVPWQREVVTHRSKVASQAERQWQGSFRRVEGVLVGVRMWCGDQRWRNHEGHRCETESSQSNDLNGLLPNAIVRCHLANAAPVLTLTQSSGSYRQMTRRRMCRMMLNRQDLASWRDRHLREC